MEHAEVVAIFSADTIEFEISVNKGNELSLWVFFLQAQVRVFTL